MKTVLVYYPKELTAAAIMVKRYNKAFQDAPIHEIEERIKECMQHFKEPDFTIGGTMGFIINAMEQEEDIFTNTRKLYLEFYFQATTYAESLGVNTFRTDAVELEIG